MNEQSAPSNGGQLTNPSKEASRQAAAPAEAEGGTTPAPRRGGDAERMTDTGEMTQAAGASPSNTAPANCISPHTPTSAPSIFKLLRYGIDSLYLSYPGTLSHEWEHDLERMKGLAQSDEPFERSTAQVSLGGHLFEVKDKGKGRYPYVLVDNCFHLQVSRATAKRLPLAYVQLSSELLTAMSVSDAEQALRFIVNTFGRVDGEAQTSRVDLFVDFVSDVSMESWHRDAWVTRAHKINTYSDQREFTGWSIGLGGVLSARLYDKTLELRQSHKDYLKPLWQAAGWQEGQSVWRLEFQFKREVLNELGVTSIPLLLSSLPGLWGYAVGSWLRLTVPNPDDATQTRWPNHPLWDRLAGVSWGSADGVPLGRLRKTRLPSDESLFVNGLGGLTSFMASQGITDLGEGFGEFLAHAERFHDTQTTQPGRNLRGYVAAKVADKARRFNTLRNETREAEHERQNRRHQQAEAYRLAKDGGESPDQ